MEGVLGTTPWKMIGQSHHFKQSPTFQSCLTSASRATRKNIASNMGGFPYNSGFDIRASDIECVLRPTHWRMIRRSRHFKKPSTFQSHLTGASHAARKHIAPNMGGLLYSSGFDIIAFDTKGVLSPHLQAMNHMVKYSQLKAKWDIEMPRCIPIYIFSQYVSKHMLEHTSNMRAYASMCYPYDSMC